MSPHAMPAGAGRHRSRNDGSGGGGVGGRHRSRNAGAARPPKTLRPQKCREARRVWPGGGASCLLRHPTRALAWCEQPHSTCHPPAREITSHTCSSSPRSLPPTTHPPAVNLLLRGPPPAHSPLPPNLPRNLCGRAAAYLPPISSPPCSSKAPPRNLLGAPPPRHLAAVFRWPCSGRRPKCVCGTCASPPHARSHHASISSPPPAAPGRRCLVAASASPPHGRSRGSREITAASPRRIMAASPRSK